MNKRFLGGVVFVLLVASVFLLIKLGYTDEMQNKTTPTPAATPSPTSTPRLEELKIEDLEVGEGAEIKKGDKLAVDYIGTLTDGTVFDSSYDRNIRLTLTLGAGEVIKGWDQGLVGMKVGGKRRLTIPPHLAYGSRAVGDIPANSVLIFEIELVEIK